MNTIIIAAIALLVLVIVSFIFMYNMRQDNQALADCETRGGECMYGCEDGYQEMKNAKCFDSSNNVDESQMCCLQI